MITLIRRDFTVDLALEKAWRHFARLDQWPSWAKHIHRVEVKQPSELGPQSSAILHLKNGVKCSFTMTEFNPYRNWKWVGRFLWLTIHYDHRFEELNPQQTRLTFVIEGEGLAVGIFGKLFAKVYNKNLDRAIPALVEMMNASK